MHLVEQERCLSGSFDKQKCKKTIVFPFQKERFTHSLTHPITLSLTPSIIVRCDIKSSATKLNVSRSITMLQFVTYAKFIWLHNTSHYYVGQRV